jgi:hypothetical protein
VRSSEVVVLDPNTLTADEVLVLWRPDRGLGPLMVWWPTEDRGIQLVKRQEKPGHGSLGVTQGRLAPGLRTTSHDRRAWLAEDPQDFQAAGADLRRVTRSDGARATPRS